jgi:PST family polysaccharide transporter
MPARPPAGLPTRTFNGFVWSLGGSAFQALLQLATLAALARLLSPADFGVVAAGLTVIGIGSIVAQLGVAPALVHVRLLKPAYAHTASAIALLLGLALAVGCALSAEALAKFFGFQSLAPLLVVLSLSFPIRALGLVAEATIQRSLRFRALGGIDVASFAIGYAGIGIGVALAGKGPWALVAAHLGQTTVRTLLLLVATRDRFGLALHAVALRRLVRFGGGLTLAQLAHAIAAQADHIIVGRALGSAPLGQYSRASQLLVMPASLVANAIDRVLFPTLARLRHDIAKLGAMYLRGIAAVGFVLIPTGCAIAVLAPEIVGALLGPGWSQAVLPLRLLASSLALRAGFQLGDSLARATGAVYRSGWRQGVYAACVIGGAAIGSRWGLGGVATGVVLACAIKFVLMADLATRIAGVRWRDLLRADREGLLLGGVVTAAGQSLAYLLREAALPPVGILAAASLALSVLIGSLIVGFPRIFSSVEASITRRYLAAIWSQLGRVVSATKPVLPTMSGNEPNRP